MHPKRYSNAYYGNPKTKERRNHFFKLNNFQLFNRNDSNIRTSIKKDLIISCDLSNNINKDTKNKIKVYCNGRQYYTDFKNDKKKAINGKHYSYERYLAKKKGYVINMIQKNNNSYYEKKIKNKNLNYLHNPCSWSDNYKIAIGGSVESKTKNKKYPSEYSGFVNPLPNGPAGAKSCKNNCPKYKHQHLYN